MQRVALACAGIALLGVVACARAGARRRRNGARHVKDPTGGVMVAVTVDISNPVSGFKRSATTDAAGRFVFRNLPPNGYHLTVGAQGFDTFERDVAVRSGVPIDLDVTLKLAGATSTRRSGRPRRGSPRARSDRPYGHRPESHGEAVARILGRD